MNTAADRRGYGAKLIALGLGLGAALLVLEIGVGLEDPRVHMDDFAGTTDFDWREPHPYSASRATPNADVVMEGRPWIELNAGPGGQARVVTDSHGFRTRYDLESAKAPGEVRVFLIGGSVTLLGIDEKTTICGRLEHVLRQNLPRAVRVICVSAGIMTAVSDQELAVLVHDVLHLEPDVVIAYGGFNDLSSRTFFDPRMGMPPNWSLTETQLQGTTELARRMREAYAGVPFWQLMLSRSRLATRIWPALRLDALVQVELVERAPDTPEVPAPDAVAEHMIRNWEKMSRITESVGADFVAALQPARADVYERPRFRSYYDQLNREIAQKQAEGATWVSLETLFSQDPEVFYDPVHTLDRGHVVIADALADAALPLPNLRRWR